MKMSSTRLVHLGNISWDLYVKVMAEEGGLERLFSIGKHMAGFQRLVVKTDEVRTEFMAVFAECEKTEAPCLE